MICKRCSVRMSSRSTEQMITEVLVEHDSVLVNLADVYSKLSDEIDIVRGTKEERESAHDQLTSDYTNAVERVQKNKEVAKAALNNADRYDSREVLMLLALPDDLYPGNLFKSAEDYLKF